MRLTLAALILSLAFAPAALGQRMIKANLVTTAVGVPHLAYERPLGERRSLQFDLMVSPWRSIDSAPFQFGVFVAEWRHHLTARGDGPYLGVHTGITIFKLQRPDYAGTDLYQEGAGALLGLTVGLQQPFAGRWTLDAFLGGGTVQSKYKGYSYLTGERYDGEEGWNESGEWLLYRGGVMLSYRLP